ncbi:MAG TPA: ATP-binding protein [Actinomycetes bacterium]|nr:ATP-binding protein [Actinomycetes bacterium]
MRDLCACWDLLTVDDPHDPLERAWLAERVDQAVLVADELVTNAVVHAHSQLCLLVELRADQLHLAVQDASPHLLRLATAPETLAEGGRGLPLVEALARHLAGAASPRRRQGRRLRAGPRPLTHGVRRWASSFIGQPSPVQRLFSLVQLDPTR